MRHTTFLSLNVNSQNCGTEDALHFSKLTGQTILIVMRISLFMKISRQISEIRDSMLEGGGFSTKTLRKSLFHFKINDH